MKNVILNKQWCVKDEKSTYNLLECQLNKTFQVEHTINNYKIVFKPGTPGDPGIPGDPGEPWDFLTFLSNFEHADIEKLVFLAYA